MGRQTTETTTVHVACAADSRFVVPLATMLASASAGLEPGRHLVAHVVDDGLSAHDRERVAASCAREGVRVEWLPSTTTALAGLPVWGRMPRTTYQRVVVDRLLPSSLGRVVWLDCDLVVEGDLGRLWDVPLGDCDLGAVQDAVVPWLSSPMGLPRAARRGLGPGRPYFNAGVMLIDLERWRARGVGERVLRYFDANRGMALFWDQEGLNAVLHDRWQPLDPRWNVNAGLTSGGLARSGRRGPSATRAAAADPWILHFCGRLKPWVLGEGDDDARRRFFAHLDRTTWAGWRPRPTVRTRAVRAYAGSSLRRYTYPAESWGLRAQARLNALQTILSGAS